MLLVATPAKSSGNMVGPYRHSKKCSATIPDRGPVTNNLCCRFDSNPKLRCLRRLTADNDNQYAEYYRSIIRNTVVHNHQDNAMNIPMKTAGAITRRNSANLPGRPVGAVRSSASDSSVC